MSRTPLASAISTMSPLCSSDWATPTPAGTPKGGRQRLARCRRSAPATGPRRRLHPYLAPAMNTTHSLLLGSRAAAAAVADVQHNALHSMRTPPPHTHTPRLLCQPPTRGEQAATVVADVQHNALHPLTPQGLQRLPCLGHGVAVEGGQAQIAQLALAGACRGGGTHKSGPVRRTAGYPPPPPGSGADSSQSMQPIE